MMIVGILLTVIGMLAVIYVVWTYLPSTKNTLTTQENEIYDTIMSIVSDPKTKVQCSEAIIFIKNPKHDITLRCLTYSLTHNNILISNNKRFIKKIQKGIMKLVKEASIKSLLEE